MAAIWQVAETPRALSTTSKITSKHCFSCAPMVGARTAAARRVGSNAKEQDSPTAWLMEFLTASPSAAGLPPKKKFSKRLARAISNGYESIPYCAGAQLTGCNSAGTALSVAGSCCVQNASENNPCAVSLAQRLECLQKVSACTMRCLSVSAQISLMALHALLQKFDASAIVPAFTIIALSVTCYALIV